jgi:hypothetical protein
MHLLDPHHAETGAAMAVALGRDVIAAYARYMLALHLWWSGSPADAAVVFAEAQQELESLGRVTQARDAQKFLGVSLVVAGDELTGLEIQRDVIEAQRREEETPFLIAHGLAYLGHCHRRIGDDHAAFADLSEAWRICERIGNRGTSIHVAIALGEIAADAGDTAQALLWCGRAITLAEAGGARTYAPWAWTVALRAHVDRGERDAAVACALRAVEDLATLPPGETVRLAYEVARLAMLVGDPVAAARLVGVATSRPDQRELPFPAPAEHRRHEAVERRIADALGSEAEEHIRVGRARSLVQAAGPVLATTGEPAPPARPGEDRRSS